MIVTSTIKNASAFTHLLHHSFHSPLAQLMAVRALTNRQIHRHTDGTDSIISTADVRGINLDMVIEVHALIYGLKAMDDGRGFLGDGRMTTKMATSRY